MGRAMVPRTAVTGFDEIVRSDPSLWEIQTVGAGPQGQLPLTAEMLLESPSGDIFGLTQNAGMGWDPRELGRPQFLMLSTQGGIRASDGKPIALGYHTGHWEIGLLMQAAAQELAALGGLPFAGFCSDPCESGPASRTASSRWSARPTWAAVPAARPAAAASSSGPRPPPRSSARRSGSRCRTPRSRPRGSRYGSTWPGARPAR